MQERANELLLTKGLGHSSAHKKTVEDKKNKEKNIEKNLCFVVCVCDICFVCAEL